MPGREARKRCRGEKGAEKMPMGERHGKDVGARKVRRRCRCGEGRGEDVGLDRREEDADAGAGDSSKSTGGGAKRC